MRIEGKIYLDYNNKVCVDAEPHIMSRIRKIFDNAQAYTDRGQYTHKPLAFVLNMQSAKDVLWLRQRYNLDVDSVLLDQIQEKSDAFDKLQRSVQNSDKNTKYQVSDQALPLAIPLREHQVTFTNMFAQMTRMLLADYLGFGKTASAISVLQEPERRPAIVVVDLGQQGL